MSWVALFPTTNQPVQRFTQFNSGPPPLHEIPVVDFGTQIGSNVEELIKTVFKSKLATHLLVKVQLLKVKMILVYQVTHLMKELAIMYALTIMTQLILWLKSQMSLLRMMIWFHHEHRSPKKMNNFHPLLIRKSKHSFKTSLRASLKRRN